MPRLSPDAFRYTRPGDEALSRWPNRVVPAKQIEFDLQSCDDLLKVHPNDMSNRFRLAELLMCGGRFFEAVDHFRAVLDSDSGDACHRRALADALAACERFPEAVTEYETLLRADSSSSATVLLLAAALSHGGLLKPAITLLQTHIQHWSDRPDVMQAIAQLLCETGEVQRASVIAKQAAYLNQSSVQTLNLLGICQLCAGQHEVAERSFRSALKLAPAYLDAHLNLAVVHKCQGRIPEALAGFEYARALHRAEPTCWQPAFDREVAQLGLIFEQQEHIAEKETLTRTKPLDEFSLTILIACYGDFPEYSIRALHSCAAGIDLKKYCDVHVGLNECCVETLAVARKLKDGGIIDLLVESPRNLNKDPMLRLLLDSVRTPYVLWIDDDNFFSKPSWPEAFSSFVRSEHPFDVSGLAARWGPCRSGDPGYMKFIRSRPWWRGIESQVPKLQRWIPFVPGGLFIARTDFLRSHDFPDRGMIRAMDDVALGELLQQVGGRLVALPAELVKIASSDGVRRGDHRTLTDGVVR